MLNQLNLSASFNAVRTPTDERVEGRVRSSGRRQKTLLLAKYQPIYIYIYERDCESEITAIKAIRATNVSDDIPTAGDGNNDDSGDG